MRAGHTFGLAGLSGRAVPRREARQLETRHCDVCGAEFRCLPGATKKRCGSECQERARQLWWSNRRRNRERLAATDMLIGRAQEEVRRLEDGGAELAACDACGLPGGLTWPDAPGERLCLDCHGFLAKAFPANLIEEALGEEAANEE